MSCFFSPFSARLLTNQVQKIRTCAPPVMRFYYESHCKSGAWLTLTPSSRVVTKFPRTISKFESYLLTKSVPDPSSRVKFFSAAITFCSSPSLEGTLEEKQRVLNNIFLIMRQRKVKMDVYHYVNYLNSLGKVSTFGFDYKKILKWMHEDQLQPDFLTYKGITWNLYRASEFAQLEQFVGYLEQQADRCPDLYSEVFRAAAYLKSPAKTISLVAKVQKMNQFNDVVYLMALKALCNFGLLKEAESLRDEMLARDFPKTRMYLSNISMIMNSMYYRLNGFHDAFARAMRSATEGSFFDLKFFESILESLLLQKKSFDGRVLMGKYHKVFEVCLQNSCSPSRQMFQFGFELCRRYDYHFEALHLCHTMCSLYTRSPSSALPLAPLLAIGERRKDLPYIHAIFRIILNNDVYLSIPTLREALRTVGAFAAPSQLVAWVRPLRRLCFRDVYLQVCTPLMGAGRFPEVLGCFQAFISAAYQPPIECLNEFLHRAVETARYELSSEILSLFVQCGHSPNHDTFHSVSLWMDKIGSRFAAPLLMNLSAHMEASVPAIAFYSASGEVHFAESLLWQLQGRGHRVPIESYEVVLRGHHQRGDYESVNRFVRLLGGVGPLSGGAYWYSFDALIRVGCFDVALDRFQAMVFQGWKFPPNVIHLFTGVDPALVVPEQLPLLVRVLEACQHRQTATAASDAFSKQIHDRILFLLASFGNMYSVDRRLGWGGALAVVDDVTVDHIVEGMISYGGYLNVEPFFVNLAELIRFHQIPPTVTLFNALLRFRCARQEWGKYQRVEAEMAASGVKGDSRTRLIKYESLLMRSSGAILESGYLSDLMGEICGQLSGGSLTIPASVFSATLRVLERKKIADRVGTTLRAMNVRGLRPNEEVCSLLIDEYMQQRSSPSKAFGVIKWMHELGIPPSTCVFTTLFKYCETVASGDVLSRGLFVDGMQCGGGGSDERVGAGKPGVLWGDRGEKVEFEKIHRQICSKCARLDVVPTMEWNRLLEAGDFEGGAMEGGELFAGVYSRFPGVLTDENSRRVIRETFLNLLSAYRFRQALDHVATLLEFLSENNILSFSSVVKHSQSDSLSCFPPHSAQLPLQAQPQTSNVYSEWNHEIIKLAQNNKLGECLQILDKLKGENQSAHKYSCREVIQSCIQLKSSFQIVDAVFSKGVEGCGEGDAVLLYEAYILYCESNVGSNQSLVKAWSVIDLMILERIPVTPKICHSFVGILSHHKQLTKGFSKLETLVGFGTIPSFETFQLLFSAFSAPNLKPYFFRTLLLFSFSGACNSPAVPIRLVESLESAGEFRELMMRFFWTHLDRTKFPLKGGE